MNQIESLQRMIDGSEKIVFFGGAGVSTESGIPDFRSVDGLYHQQYAYPPETVLSHSFFNTNPQVFYDFYRNKILRYDAQPNPCHQYLAELERQGKLLAVVTQNIDGLHQKAGSKVVYELHGSAQRNHCTRCRKSYGVADMLGEGLPLCTCGGLIKPDVVLYEEGLDENTVEGAVMAISQCDMLIIGGTSLAVYPAASFVRYYKGDKLVVVNKSKLQVQANLVMDQPIGAVFSQLR